MVTVLAGGGGRAVVLSSEVMVCLLFTSHARLRSCTNIRSHAGHRWRTRCLIIGSHKLTLAQISTLKSSFSIRDGRIVVASRDRGWTYMLCCA